MTAPCRDCQDRELKCHASCDRYRDFREKRDAFNDIKYRKQEELHTILSLRSKPRKDFCNSFVQKRALTQRGIHK